MTVFLIPEARIAAIIYTGEDGVEMMATEAFLDSFDGPCGLSPGAMMQEGSWGPLAEMRDSYFDYDDPIVDQLPRNGRLNHRFVEAFTAT